MSALYPTLRWKKKTSPSGRVFATRDRILSREANTYLVGIDAFVSTAWISALFLVTRTSHFQLSERWWGILNAFYLLSMIAGSYMMLRRRGTRSLLYRSIGFSIAATFLFAFAPIVTLAVIACLFQGFASQVRAIELNTLLQTTTPLERLPYVL